MQKTTDGCIAAGVVFIFVLLMSIPMALIAALPTLIAWNVGIVGAGHALGGHLTTISYWTAFGLCFVIREVRALFIEKPHPTLEVLSALNSKK